MPVQVKCPYCSTPLQVADGDRASSYRCARCSGTFSLQPPPPPSTPPSFAGGRLDIGCATSPGKVAPRNEDSFLVRHLVAGGAGGRHEVAVAVVADGMGGHGQGDVASGLVVRAVGRTLGTLLDGALSGQFKDVTPPLLADGLTYALQEANRAVFRKAQATPECQGMGATVAAALVWDGDVLIGHAGDCRVYHQRGNVLTQLTRDQTLVARMVELGKLTPQQALTHPARNQVTNSIGRRFEFEGEQTRAALIRGDWLIVACDGLHAHVPHGQLQVLLAGNVRPAAQVAQALVDHADAAGGSDNCTVIAIHVV